MVRAARRTALHRALRHVAAGHLDALPAPPRRALPRTWITRSTSPQSLAFNLVAAVIVFAILVGTWALSNLARHRPPFSWPREVGLWELGVYVFGPALPALVLGEVADAGKAVLVGLLSLLVVYFGTSYGVVPMLRSAASARCASSARSRPSWAGPCRSCWSRSRSSSGRPRCGR